MRSMFETSSGQNRRFDEFGDGNSPTEPMIPIILTPYTTHIRQPEVQQHPESEVPVVQAETVSSPQSRRSPVPIVVGIVFVCVQVVLLARVVLMLFGVDSSISWTAWLYVLSGGFAWPFKLLIERLPVPAQIAPEVVSYVSPLLAILVYGFLSRIMVRFLKAFLNSR